MGVRTGAPPAGDAERPCERRPVGFFDSGVGGLSIWRAAVAALPCEPTIYLADNAGGPYGGRDAAFVVGRSRANAEWLLARGCKMVVVACNTATAAAIDALRAAYADVPFIGVEPAVRPAALASRSHVVGVLATQGTLHGRLFRETAGRLPAGTRVVVRQVSGWVEAVERGETAPTPPTLALVRSQIRPLLDEGADSLVLGCTHFPFLREAIQAVAGPGVALYDPAAAVARQIGRVLSARGLLAPPGPPPGRLFESTGARAPLARALAALQAPPPAGGAT